MKFNKTKFSTHWLIVFFAALFVACVAPPAMAQHSADPLTLSGVSASGGTNAAAVVPALSTNVYDVVTVTRGQNAALQIQFIALNASTSNLTVRVDTSLDGPNTGSTNWMLNQFVYVIPATGTNQTTYTTNWNIGAIGYLRVSLSNTNAVGGFTNIIGKVSQKPGI